MKRAVWFVLAAVVLGLATTVGLAWWLALRGVTLFSITCQVPVNSAPEGAPAFRSRIQVNNARRAGHSVAYAANGSVPITRDLAVQAREYLEKNPQVYHYAAAMSPLEGHRTVWPSWLPLPPADSPPIDLWGARASGWPLLCLKALDCKWSSGTGASAGSLRVLGGDAPISPIWPGLVSNTLLFGAVWAGLLCVPAMARRARCALRRRRGLCEKCGYDLRGLAPGAACPECGESSAAR